MDRMVQDVRFGIRTLAKILLFPWSRWALWRLGSARTPRCSACSIRWFCGFCRSAIPSSLVIVRETGNHYGNSYGPNTISWPMFEDLRDNNHVFSGMFCRFPASVTIGYGDHVGQISAELVSGPIFRYWALGRYWGAPSATTTTPFPTASRSWCSAIASGEATLTRTEPLLGGPSCSIVIR